MRDLVVKKDLNRLTDYFMSNPMIKWPWSSATNETSTHYPWQEALAIPLLSVLSGEETERLKTLAARILEQKQFVPVQGLEFTPAMEARLACLFALPVLELGIEWLDGFHEVLIYPEPFIYDEPWQDDMGLVHSSPEVQSGQSLAQGPIVLNWLDIRDSFDFSGYNLVIHETAHKLDMRYSGVATGVPLINLRDIPQWEHDLHAVIEAIQEEIDVLGEEGTSLDAYAASDPAECFAVLSEYFFSAPELLAERFPLMYQHLVKFYRQDTLARVTPLQPH